VSIFEFDTKHRIGQGIHDRAGKLDLIFLRHKSLMCLYEESELCPKAAEGSKSLASLANRPFFVTVLLAR